MGFFQANPRREIWIPLQIQKGGTFANNGYLNLRMFQDVSTAIFSIPSWIRKIQVPSLMTGFTTNPVANSFQISFLPYYTSGNNAWGTPIGSETVTTLTATQNYTNSSNQYRYYFTSTYEYELPSDAITDANVTGMFSMLIRFKNTSGGSLTQVTDNWFGGVAVCY